MMVPNAIAADSAAEQDLRPRARQLSWLLAWCAFGDRSGTALADSEL
jgi:hypothetical protein